MELKDINPAIADHLCNAKKGNLSLYPPTTDLAIRISSLLEKDPRVFTKWSYAENTLTLYVKGAKKAEALNYLLGHKEHDIKIKVKVVEVREDGSTEELPTPTYDVTMDGIIGFLKDALNGIGFGWQFNDVYVPITQTTYHFLEIEAKPIAIPNDNFGNPYGFTVMLAADLLKDAFDLGGLMVSTYVRRCTGEISADNGALGYAFTW